MGIGTGVSQALLELKSTEKAARMPPSWVPAAPRPADLIGALLPS